ncbi:MAG: HAMP domain-containing sensor histidine kinase [Bacteroidota bacterium]
MENWNRTLKRLIWRNLGKDATPTKELESLFQQISDSLDSQDKEYILLSRIMDLSSEELFDANEELRKRNEELDRFVYSTSHDLRAPLTSIMGLLQLIELTDSEVEKTKYLEQIKMSTQQLDSFIQEIVSYTHNKKVGLLSESIDFQKLIDQCFDKLAFMNAHKQVEKQVSIEGGESFSSDPQRLDNLMSNLLSNSIKYFDPEKENPFVKISVNNTGCKAFINIEDNGVGIKEEHQDKIFEMFYRASAKSKGSGIGLYIVKEIVEKLNGTIALTSKLGVGTSFEIMIPNNSKLDNE